MKTAWLAAAAAAALVTAAQPAMSQTKAAAAAAANAPRDLSKAPRMGRWGFDLSGRDTSVAPGHSLFQHANGTYLRRMEIPADRSSYGAFNALDELSRDPDHASELYDRVAERLEAERRGPPAGGPLGSPAPRHRSVR